jgi:hypothetical protein
MTVTTPTLAGGGPPLLPGTVAPSLPLHAHKAATQQMLQTNWEARVNRVDL